MCGGAAIKAGMSILEELGGRIMYFGSTIPSIGVAKVQNRFKKDLVNSDKEAKQMLAPADDKYQAMAQECIQFCIAVDLFIAVPNTMS